MMHEDTWLYLFDLPKIEANDIIKDYHKIFEFAGKNVSKLLNNKDFILDFNSLPFTLIVSNNHFWMVANQKYQI